MTNYLLNVSEEARVAVGRDRVALELSGALEGIFSITDYWKRKKHDHSYTIIFCQPTKTTAQALLIDREVLGLIIPFETSQQRTITVAKELIADSSGRLDQAMVLIVHADPSGDDLLRAWGRENGLKVIPVFRSRGGALPSSAILRQKLAHELFSADPFQVTGPVVGDMDFFGRRNQAIETLRQLNAGRIRALFGMRKIGKTSLINRIIKLAQEAKQPSVAMIDCSLKGFNKLSSDEALKSLAKVAKMAATRGYAHISDALKRTDKELIPQFEDLWAHPNTKPLLIIFDEIDYISPDSPTAPHWKSQFNDFWREFRVLVQEGQRHNLTISILVSGVSSKYFRTSHIGSIENSALHIVPEEYLSPFDVGASTAMLTDLGKRCGLRFTTQAKSYIIEVCGGFPFWMRMAGSHIHRSISVDERPKEVELDEIKPILEDFIAGEGAEIARVAIQHMIQAYPEVIKLLRTLKEKGELPYETGRLLVGYGLAVQDSKLVRLKSQLVVEGLKMCLADEAPGIGEQPTAKRTLHLEESEWAEELASINKRRNILERRLREFVRFGLKFSAKKTTAWSESIRQALSAKRKSELSGLSGEQLLNRLYWSDLSPVFLSSWDVFSDIFQDKAAFVAAMKTLNERPDAHAKEIDLADLALLRRHLQWLESRVIS